MSGSDRILTWRQVSHRLVDAPIQPPEQITSWMGGVQAQDYRWGKWSIGLRAEDVAVTDVECALQDGRILRTWMFRGTLHFVAADDLPWLTALIAPRTIQTNARRYCQLQLDEPEFAASQAVLQEELVNGPLTRNQIKTHFQTAGISCEGQQMPYLLQRAALDGLISCGPQAGSEPTYTLLPKKFTEARIPERQELLALLASRYFASHGPATLKDFSWWSGLTAADCKQAVGQAGITTIDNAYLATGDPPSGEILDTADLLSPYDDYLLGYKERDRMLDPAYKKRVNPGGGIPRPTVLLNGRIAGIWRYDFKKDRLEVTIEPFQDLIINEKKCIEVAGSRLGSFLDTAVHIDYASAS